MDGFELKPKKTRLSPKAVIFNLLTVLVLLAIGWLLYYMATIFLNPYSPLNLFPPQAIPTRYQTPTSTWTPIQLEPTWTSTPTIAPSATRTKAPTWTLLPELITPSVTLTPTETLEPTITSTPMPVDVVFEFAASTTIHADSACNWFGVGGTVLNVNGSPLTFQTVQLGGTLNGQAISRLTLSGNAPAYGASGFEFVLGQQPLASTQTLWIQLFDNTGKPLTQKIYFDTSASCEENLVLVTFTKTR
jgi:hypothetical protein